jgi:hypothetical protein
MRATHHSSHHQQQQIFILKEFDLDEREAVVTVREKADGGCS